MSAPVPSTYPGPSVSAPKKLRAPPKNSKVKSCAECRRLKLKCDRNVPCQHCIRRSVPDMCPHMALTVGARDAEAAKTQAMLQKRIASLEATIASGGRAVPEAGEQESEHDGESDSTDDAPTPPPPVNRSKGKSRGSIALPPVPTILTNEQGHLTVGSDNYEASHYFGDASSLYFAAGDQPAAEEGVKGLFPPGWLEMHVHMPGSAWQQTQDLMQLSAQLPDYDKAQMLADVYFTVSWGTAIVDEGHFRSRVLPRAYSGSPLPAQTLAVVFFVLALGSLFEPNAPAGAINNPMSREYFALGRSCLCIDSSSSTRYVQALHLMVTWMSNAGRAVTMHQSTWTLIGQAMRVMQALGLHRDGEYFGLPQEEVVERRRLFWEVYSYDVSQSIHTGRPRSITDSAYDVQMPATSPDRDAYHEQRYRISRLAGRINDEQTRCGKQSYSAVLDIDKEVRRYVQELPAELLDEEPPAGRNRSRETHMVQKLATRFRWNEYLLVLHRSWFTRALLESSEEPLKSQYSLSYIGCIEACKGMIETVQRLAIEAPGKCYRRWFFLFGAFTACVCLSAALIRAPRSMLNQSILASLEQGIAVYEKAARATEVARLRKLLATAKARLSSLDTTAEADTEDLDLLGKGAKVSTTTPIANTLDAAAVNEPLNTQQPVVDHAQDLFAVQMTAQPPFHPAQGLNGMMGYDQRPPADFRTGFDFDAFLANFGVNNELGTDLMGTGGAFI